MNNGIELTGDKVTWKSDILPGLPTINENTYDYKSLNQDDLVLVETAKRFKGLESKIIILWILNEEDTSDSLLYVSISRARLRLWVSCSKAMKNRLAI